MGRETLGIITEGNFMGNKLLLCISFVLKNTLLATDPQQGSNFVKKIFLIISSICIIFS